MEQPSGPRQPDSMIGMIMIADPDVCSGCQSCVLACSFMKSGTFWRSHSRISVNKIESKCLGIPVMCEHCETPPCREVCPVDAIRKDVGTGRVTIDPELCTGCRKCISACPFGELVIRMSNKIAVICDLCDGKPACVAVCQQGALIYMPTTVSGVRRKWELTERRFRMLASDRIARVESA